MQITEIKINCCISLSCLPSGLQSCFQAIWSFPLYEISLTYYSPKNGMHIFGSRWDSNLGLKTIFLLEFERWWLRPLCHHGWIFSTNLEASSHSCLLLKFSLHYQSILLYRPSTEIPSGNKKSKPCYFSPVAIEFDLMDSEKEKLENDFVMLV